MTARPITFSSRRAEVAFYFLWAIFWLLMIVVAVQDHLHDPYTRWWEPILWEGSSGATATIWLITRRRRARFYTAYLDRPVLWIGHQLKWLPLLIVAFIVIIYSVRHGVYALAGKTYVHESWSYLLLYESVKVSLFMGLWLCVIFAFESFELWQTQREQLIASQKALAEAQLEQLKAQLRPHFLFNALNTISSLMQTDVEKADRLLAKLGDLLRVSLQAGESDHTALRAEIDLLKLYADVMSERFGQRVAIDWRIAPETEGAQVPSLLLQPLLENAFKHGVEKSIGHEHIVVESARENGTVRLSIRNTGSTLGSSQTTGIGLRNCRERLRVLFGEQSSVTLKSIDNGVEAVVVLPFRESAA